MRVLSTMPDLETISAAKRAGPGTNHRNSVYDEFCVYDDRHVVVLWMIKLQ